MVPCKIYYRQFLSVYNSNITIITEISLVESCLIIFPLSLSLSFTMSNEKRITAVCYNTLTHEAVVPIETDQQACARATVNQHETRINSPEAALSLSPLELRLSRFPIPADGRRARVLQHPERRFVPCACAASRERERERERESSEHLFESGRVYISACGISPKDSSLASRQVYIYLHSRGRLRVERDTHIYVYIHTCPLLICSLSLSLTAQHGFLFHAAAAAHENNALASARRARSVYYFPLLLLLLREHVLCSV